jgi:hypothetical protein
MEEKFVCLVLDCTETIDKELVYEYGWYVDTLNFISICPQCLDMIINEYLNDMFSKRGHD